MRNKIVTGLVQTALLMIMLTLSSNSLIPQIVQASPEARVYVDPPTIADQNLTPGSNFTVNVMVADVAIKGGCYGWQVNMSFNPNVIEYLKVTIGDFLGDQPEGTLDNFKLDKAAQGWILFSSITFGSYPGVNGSGTLAIVEFHVAGLGESVINMDHPLTYLLTNWGIPPPAGHQTIEEFPSTKENGYFSNEWTWASALELEGVETWYWTSDTEIYSVVASDVDGDGSGEIVTGGKYWGGERENAQLCVWDGSTLALEDVTAWYWTADTEISSVAVGDVDSDSSVEIVTGGSHYDIRTNAQLCVWDGSTLALENVKTWFWTSDTFISSVVVGDVDADESVEIVTAGYHDDGVRWNAQLCVWDGSTLALENVATWYWTDWTLISSVAAGDVDGDTFSEIVTGGNYNDGTRNIAQLCVWDGSSLALEDVTAWYWTDATGINSVAIGDVDGDSSVEIATGGYYLDGTRTNAQLCVWGGATLPLEKVTTWYWTSHTVIRSLAVSNVDADESIEIVSSGSYFDGVRWNAQLCVWDGSSSTLEDVKTWYWTSDTLTNSATTGNIDSDNSVEIVTGGNYYDYSQSYAQLTVWSFGN